MDREPRIGNGELIDDLSPLFAVYGRILYRRQPTQRRGARVERAAVRDLASLVTFISGSGIESFAAP
jgi:hypothetical protein